MNIIQAIEARQSVRTYLPRVVDEASFADFCRMCESADSPFGGRSALYLKLFDMKGPQHPGTYGTISGCTSYFLVASAPDDASISGAGFKMEKIVLEATRRGFGTCWLGGTFRHSDFAAPCLPDGMKVYAIVALGYAASHMRLRDKITKILAGSKRRRPFGEMFFENDFKTPLNADNIFAKALEMMRLAPSSLNSQPWRAIVEKGEVAFYSIDGERTHLLDCGIGLCHFYEAINAQGVTGRFVAKPDRQNDAMHYLTSYLPDN